ncbi:type II toxin-antitoxin system TacA family antitoxin [Desulfolutivibrio sulfodismutans]|nr:DUF1778 domain-containing protein [Desulfolutivibrio sulfodismutans]
MFWAVVSRADHSLEAVAPAGPATAVDGYGNLPYFSPMNSRNTTARLEARLPGEIHALLKRAAELQGRSLTDFVVTAASEAARKTIEDMEILRLSADDQLRIAQAVLDPPSPVPALVRAAKRHRERVDPA